MMIDINCDLGEGMGNDASIMPFVTSCSIACGGHAGTAETMRNALLLAKQYDIKAGAHPSYPDLLNFGRQEVIMKDSELIESLQFQIKSLEKIASNENVTLNHIKLHGALYNKAARDVHTASLIIKLMRQLNKSYHLYVPFGSELAKMALDQKINVKIEVFADRNYNDDLSLVSRVNLDAIIDVNGVASHVEHIVKRQLLRTISGALFPVKADTMCVHGDHPEVLEILTKIRQIVS